MVIASDHQASIPRATTRVDTPRPFQQGVAIRQGVRGATSLAWKPGSRADASAGSARKQSTRASERDCPSHGTVAAEVRASGELANTVRRRGPMRRCAPVTERRGRRGSATVTWDDKLPPSIFEVRTEIVVAATPEQVRRQVVSFPDLPISLRGASQNHWEDYENRSAIEACADQSPTANGQQDH